MTPFDLAREDPSLAHRLQALAAAYRMVFVAGLPGTGKSLVIRELARAALDAGSLVHLVQWDVVRPALEASDAGRRYPLVDGVTHVVIRWAAGLWVREAVARWHADHPAPAHLLIGETPLIGGRFIELARVRDDAAEPWLAAPSCRFVIPVPSRPVRVSIEAERDRRMTQPVHPREREDAPSRVLRALWDDLVGAARRLGLPEAPPASAGSIPYDPAVYEAVYRRLLARRHVDAVPMTRILPLEGISAYALPGAVQDLIPSVGEAEECIRGAEAAYPDLAALSDAVEQWYVV